jgi:hypothetical protein
MWRTHSCVPRRDFLDARTGVVPTPRLLVVAESERTVCLMRVFRVSGLAFPSSMTRDLERMLWLRYRINYAILTAIVSKAKSAFSGLIRRLFPVCP